MSWPLLSFSGVRVSLAVSTPTLRCTRACDLCSCTLTHPTFTLPRHSEKWSWRTQIDESNQDPARRNGNRGADRAGTPFSPRRSIRRDARQNSRPGRARSRPLHHVVHHRRNPVRARLDSHHRRGRTVRSVSGIDSGFDWGDHRRHCGISDWPLFRARLGARPARGQSQIRRDRQSGRARGMENRAPHATLAGVSLQLAQLRLRPDGGDAARLRARDLDRNYAGHRALRLYRLDRRQPRDGRPVASHAGAMGAEHCRSRGHYRRRHICEPPRLARAQREFGHRRGIIGDTSSMGHEALTIAPLDAHNQRLIASVRPEGWKNPAPAPRYNMVVIGAGTAGLVTAAGAAGLGAKVALIERDLMGGDCLNFGCVPSKALIAASRAAAAARDAKRFGVIVPEGVRVDFPAVMARMRALRADLAKLDSAARFTS